MFAPISIYVSFICRRFWIMSYQFMWNAAESHKIIGITSIEKLFSKVSALSSLATSKTSNDSWFYVRKNSATLSKISSLWQFFVTCQTWTRFSNWCFFLNGTSSEKKEGFHSARSDRLEKDSQNKSLWDKTCLFYWQKNKSEVAAHVQTPAMKIDKNIFKLHCRILSSM